MVGGAGWPRTATARRVEDGGGGWAAKEVGSLAAVVLDGRGEEEAGARRKGEARRGVRFWIAMWRRRGRVVAWDRGSTRGAEADARVGGRTRGPSGRRTRGQTRGDQRNIVPIFYRIFILFKSRDIN
jgi:hypothetical protein